MRLCRPTSVTTQTFSLARPSHPVGEARIRDDLWRHHSAGEDQRTLEATPIVGTVFACGTSANKKMWTRLTIITLSTEQVGVRQVEGVNIAHQLLAVRGWDGVFFS